MEKKKVIDYVIFGVLCLGIVLVTVSLFLPFVAVESFTVSSLKEIFTNVGQKLSFDDKLVVAQGACELIFLLGGLIGFVIGLVFSIINAVKFLKGQEKLKTASYISTVLVPTLSYVLIFFCYGDYDEYSLGIGTIIAFSALLIVTVAGIVYRTVEFTQKDKSALVPMILSGLAIFVSVFSLYFAAYSKYIVTSDGVERSINGFAFFLENMVKFGKAFSAHVGSKFTAPYIIGVFGLLFVMVISCAIPSLACSLDNAGSKKKPKPISPKTVAAQMIVFPIIVAVFMMVGFLGVLGTCSATNYGGAAYSFGFNSYSIIFLVFCGVSLVLAIAARITAKKSY
ncbi:MAG: hypothetical protein IJQ72_01860 [Bacilli bacterium]|nr:hypothetical protein [Bacilli bacterium]